MGRNALSLPATTLVCGALLSLPVQANDFDDWSLALTGCAEIDGDGRLVLTTCYDPGTHCHYSSATLVASVPGTFTVDLEWDVTGEKEYMTLDIWSDEGGWAFTQGAPFGSDAWCEPMPCGGATEGIEIHAGAEDLVRFELTSHSELCTPSSDDGTRCILDNITFVPDPGIYDLGHAHDASPIYALPPESFPDTDWVSSLTRVGDVDGDGVDDLAFGSPFTNVHGNSKGRVTVFSGATGETLFQHQGVKNGELGRSVAGVGDVDGDGVPDIAAGAHEYPGTFHPPGRVLVWSGSDGRVLLELVGPASSTDFGEVVAGVGDVDGDGRGDIAVGAPGADPNGSFSGRLHVYSGADGELIHSFPGDAPFDKFGEIAAGVGDVDADGVPDIAGGSDSSDFGADQGGLIRVFSGATGEVLHDFTGLDNDYFARVLSAAGDVDGDGHADIAFGSSSADSRSGLSSAGRIEVRSGATGELLFVKGGTETGQHFGYSVVGVGDFDGDGFDDVAMSDHEWEDRGRGFVFGGPDGHELFEFSSHNHTLLSWALAGGFDIDGDGRDDLVSLAQSVADEATILAISGAPDDQGAPALRAVGTLEPESPLSLEVAGGPAFGLATLVLGFSTLDEITLGGFLVPTPDRVLPGLVLDADGAAEIQATWPAAFVAPLSLVVQVWILEPGAASGFVATNAIALDPE